MGNMIDRALGGLVVPSSPSDPDSGSVTPARATHFDYVGPRVSAVTENGLLRSVTYDEHGNETSYIARRTYTCSGRSRTTEKEWITTWSPQYDGRGVRVVRTETPVADPNGWAAKRTFVYSPELQLLSVTADDRPNLWGKRAVTNDVFIPRYGLVYFAGQPVAQIDGATGAVRYTFTDHLGTPLLQTSANATVIWQAEYEPFGNVWQMRTGGFAEQPLRFPGQYVATTWEGSEENYNIHRWYRSGWGRYTQADPIGPALETNEYAYASDDPTSAVDPLGESTINVTKSSEQTYDTLAAYQSANPCHVNGASFSCTERISQRLSCVCRCIAKDSYAMDVTVDVQLKYHLAGGPPSVPRPRAFFWNAYRQHVNLHLNDLITKVTAHADSLESNRYTTMDDCNRGCGAAIGGFSDWMNQWATDSNRRLH